ncbi:3-oxoacyl-ACP synthase [Heyndrickxia shackletonii]|uniref:Beta-ketoacyl-[acyl-carrier-protein] synthase III n=1 Tax=Heyndrickxia shackletonii TaxID=157838 RepID=A0A0Q3WUE4_9BACI|nr:ketoacyl-ACP synthase III [Heyndrickxia shackletonii]KQL52341.1 3-oxoacyl-ACP synthase [Heyndrickxia shackletonii]NEZ01670.1 ketoacyl-ACP synthase III [Heyndrickxia shackletonii]
MNSTARITAIGTYVPQKILQNQDLEKMVDTNDEWIVQRTGMRERRISGEEEFASTLAFKAIENLMETYNKSLQDVDCIVVSTTTPDYVYPSVACQIQDYFQIPHTGAFDLNATCAGFTYALHVANSFITSGLHQKVLVVATETLTKVTDYTDRSTCILFGDGAGAVLVEKDEGKPSFIATHMGTNGDGGIHVYRSNLATTMFGHSIKADRKIVQNGREVYKWVSRTLPPSIDKLMQKAEINPNGIDWFVPHSANLRMIESVCERSGIPMEKTLTSAEFYGNTSSVTIPLALDLGIREGKVKNGDIMMVYGFGSGLTHAGHIIRWDLD